MGIFIKQRWQILAMAFPAMILASALTGVLLYAMLGGEWHFMVCWLIGVITSATDPVAVVALLKDLGAAKTLGTLIEGESLLNDGSAVVLYVWVRSVIGYDYMTVPPPWMSNSSALDSERYMGDIGTNFVVVVVQMLFFGALFGFMFGYATRWLLVFVYNDKFVEGTLVLGMSYLCFWLGELIVGTSAVIAVVVMGLYMNLHRSAMSPEVLHYMHQFYEMVAHILNTVIFAIAGTKLGTLFGDGKLREIFSLFGWQVMAIYPIVLFTRGVAILVFYPLLKRWGTGCTWQEAVVMWWGGLRGSVGLALALAVAHTEYDANQWGYGTHNFDNGLVSLDCRDQPHVVLLMNLVVVGFTVVINGLTMAPLMRVLNLTGIPEDRRFQLNTAYLQMKEASDEYLTKLKQMTWAHHGADWDFVQKRMVQHPKLYADITDHNRAAWMAVLCIERASYLAQFEDGVLSDDGFEELENFMATVTADAAVAKTSDLSDMYDRRFKQLLTRLDKKHPTVSHKKLVYEVFVAYHNAQDEAKHVMHLFEQSVQTQKKNRARASMLVDNFKKSSDSVGSESSLSIGPNGESLEDLEDIMKANKDEQELGFNALTLVQREHDDNVEDMAELFERVQLACSTRASKLEFKKWKSQHALTMMLLHQRKIVDHMRHEGVLADLDASPLLDEINQKLAKLKVDPIVLGVKEKVQRASIMLLQRPSEAVEVVDWKLKPRRSGELTSARSGTLGAIAAESSATPQLEPVTDSEVGVSGTPSGRVSMNPDPPGTLSTIESGDSVKAHTDDKTAVSASPVATETAKPTIKLNISAIEIVPS